jgi:biopolymer transport protein ExbD
MKLHRRKNNVPGLNTTSTADISFMFLIFFLVTTSMYVDKGIMNRLPPKDKEKQEQKEITVDKKNIFSLKLSADGVITVNDSVMSQKDLKAAMADFITHRGEQHLITIEADPECKYDVYFHVQNSLSEAYNDVREARAMLDYGRSMAQLTETDRDAVLEKYPRRVAENYNEGGTK